MNIREQLDEEGFVVLDNLPLEQAESTVKSLGTLLQSQVVTQRLESKSLVCSAKELPLHTDHHRAKYIGLYCQAQSQQGGDSLLLDGLAAVEELKPEAKRTLRSVKLMEHKVFEDDQEDYPCLTEHPDGSLQLYYSYWLVKAACGEQELSAINKLRKNLESKTPVRFRLQAGQLLLFDNHRMLHGRKSFPKGSNRTLIRYWIGK